MPLSEIELISESQILNFKDKDIISVEDFLNTEDDILLTVKGIGAKTLEKIKDSINSYMESKSNS